MESLSRRFFFSIFRSRNSFSCLRTEKTVLKPLLRAIHLNIAKVPSFKYSTIPTNQKRKLTITYYAIRFKFLSNANQIQTSSLLESGIKSNFRLCLGDGRGGGGGRILKIQINQYTSSIQLQNASVPRAFSSFKTNKEILLDVWWLAVRQQWSDR